MSDVPRLSPLAEMGERLSNLVLSGRRPRGWLPAFVVAVVLAVVFAATISAVLGLGVGLFGLNVPVAWAFPIVLTIWWVGIAHAGTLISAVLLLTRQRWRTPIVRMAEAMSMFAIVVAGLFPILHLGRPWFFYYLLPYPSTTQLWPQWKSPLVWDIFAITTYLVFTFCFFYLALLPDFATLRDKARSKAGQYFYGILALGWRGRAVEWRRYEQGYFALAFLAAPIVILVTGIISLDLSVSMVPGYHFTIFPPYFICGALFSGFATVIVIAVTVRWMYGLHDLITPDHIERLAKLMLAFGLVVNYAYMMEMFTAFYSGLDYYRYVYIDRWTGPYAPFWWSMIVCNVVVLQLVWFKRVRRSLPAMLCIGIVVDIGMWLERYQIVLTSTHADYMPSSWDVVWPTVADLGVLVGSIGFFLVMMLIFMRLAPIVSIKESREQMVEGEAGHG
ncbi:MAG: NrfD/PsrC family molybdoenzyme membrane anchor subunit [Paracoccaceae bacterium]